MITSKELTVKINMSADPKAEEQKVINAARYFVSQSAAGMNDQDVINVGFFQGREVVPGPRANPKLGGLLPDYNINTLHDLGITFMDVAGTMDGDEEVFRAPYGVMTDAEADLYESEILKGFGKSQSKVMSAKV